MTKPPNGRKRGRPRSEHLAIVRALLGREWSDRTVARYARALRQMQAIRLSEQETAEIIQAASRSNGTLNVSKLGAIAESLAAMWLTHRCEAEDVGVRS